MAPPVKYRLNEGTITLPAQLEDHSTHIFTTRSGPQPAVSLVINRQQKEVDQSLVDLIAEQICVMKQIFQQFVEVEASDVTVAGTILGRQVVHEFQTEHGITVRQSQVYVPFRGQLLIFTGTAPSHVYETWKPIFDARITGFEFTDSLPVPQKSG